MKETETECHTNKKNNGIFCFSNTALKKAKQKKSKKCQHHPLSLPSLSFICLYLSYHVCDMALERIFSLVLCRPSALLWSFLIRQKPTGKRQKRRFASSFYSWRHSRRWAVVWPLFTLIHRCYFWDTLAELQSLLCSTSAACWLNWVLENSSPSSSVSSAF